MQNLESDILDLDALVKPVQRVRLFGQERDVFPADGRAVDLLQQQQKRQANGDPGALTFVEVARQIVRSCINDLTEEDALRLSIEQLTALIGIATRQVDKVRTLIDSLEDEREGPAGNAERPASARKSKTRGSPAQTSSSR